MHVAVFEIKAFQAMQDGVLLVSTDAEKTDFSKINRGSAYSKNDRVNNIQAMSGMENLGIGMIGF